MLRNSEEKFQPGACAHCQKANKEQEQKHEQSLREAERRRNWRLLKKHTYLPPKLEEVTFDDVRIVDGNQKAAQVLQRIENADRWVYIWGDNATGKSFLLAAGVNRVLRSLQRPALYLNEQVFFDTIKASWGSTMEFEREVRDRVNRADYIYWDEFGMRPLFRTAADMWRYEIVYGIFELMCNEMKQVVFASNLNLHYNIEDDIEGPWEGATPRVGKRIVSRLKRNNLYEIKLTNAPFF